MILDLNALAVESFDTSAGETELQMLPRTVTKNVVVCGIEDGGPQAPTYPYASCGCVDL